MSGVTLHHPQDSQDHKYNQEIQQLGPVFTTHQTPLPTYDTDIQEKMANLNNLLNQYNGTMQAYQVLRQRSAEIASVLFNMQTDENSHHFIRLLPKIFNQGTSVMNMYTEDTNITNKSEYNYYSCGQDVLQAEIKDSHKGEHKLNHQYCHAPLIHFSDTTNSNAPPMIHTDQPSVADCFVEGYKPDTYGPISNEQCFNTAYSTYGNQLHYVYRDTDEGNLCYYTKEDNDSKVPKNATKKYKFLQDKNNISKFHSKTDEKLFWVPYKQQQTTNDKKLTDLNYVENTELANTLTENDYDNFENFVLIRKPSNGSNGNIEHIYHNLTNMIESQQTIEPINIKASMSVEFYGNRHNIHIQDDLSNYIIVNTSEIYGIHSTLYIRKKIPSGMSDGEFEKKSGYAVKNTVNGDYVYDYPSSGGNPREITSLIPPSSILDTPPVDFTLSPGLQNLLGNINVNLEDGGAKEITTQISNEYSTIVTKLRDLSKDINTKLQNLYHYRTFGVNSNEERNVVNSNLLSKLNPTTRAIVDGIDGEQPEVKQISAGYANHLTNETMNEIMKQIGKNYMHITEDQKNLEKLYMMGEDTKILGKSQYHMYIIYLLAIILVFYGLYKASK